VSIPSCAASPVLGTGLPDPPEPTLADLFPQLNLANQQQHYRLSNGRFKEVCIGTGNQALDAAGLPSPVVQRGSSPLPPILMTTHIGTEWLTSQQAASYLKVKPRTLLQWARQGTVKGFVLSGTRRITWRFLQADLDAMLHRPSVAEFGGIR